MKIKRAIEKFLQKHTTVKGNEGGVFFKSFFIKVELFGFDLGTFFLDYKSVAGRRNARPKSKNLRG